MPDFTSLMKQAAQLQAKMEAMQAELGQIEVEGTAGGGAVTVKLSAKTELKSVAIDAALLRPEDKEIVEHEQRAYDAQGADWNNEVFPALRDLRGVLARCGRPIESAQ